MLRIAPLLALGWLGSCAGSADETLTAYGALGQSYRVVEIDGQPFAAQATVSFPAPGEIRGEAPCNTFFGEVTEPYPWFGTGGLASTRRACRDLAQEAQLLSALSEMEAAEISGPVLILSIPGTGRSVLLQAVEAR